MNKDIILMNIKNLTFNTSKFNIFLPLEETIGIFFNIFINLELYDWTNYGIKNANLKIAYIIRTIVTSCYNNIKLYQDFISYIYAFARTNNFLNDIDKIYNVVNNLKCVKPNYLEKYFVPFINKPNSYGIDKALYDMFGGSIDRYRYNYELDNKLYLIIIKLSKMDLTINIINDFEGLVFNVCVSIHHIYDCNDLIDIFCLKYSITN